MLAESNTPSSQEYEYHHVSLSPSSDGGMVVVCVAGKGAATKGKKVSVRDRHIYTQLWKPALRLVKA